MRSVNRRPGFTLIELLVVIAIIAILAAILFPVILAVKERANTAKCQAHEKELCAALMLYVDDYHGMLPYMQFLSWWHHGPLELHLYDKYVKNNEIVICPQPYYDTAYHPGPRRMAYGYNECLISRLTNSYFNVPGAGGKVKVYNVEWVMHPVYHVPVGRGRMVGDIKTPGKTPCFFCTFSHHTSPDGIPRGFGWGADDAVNTKRHPNRHGSGSNYALLDGHVIFSRPAGGVFVVPIDGLDYDGNGTYGGNGIMR